MLKKNKIENEIGIRLHGIELISMNMHTKPSPEFVGNEFNFAIKVDLKVLKEIEVVAAIVNIDIIEKNTNLNLASLSVGVGVIINQFNDFIKLNKDNLYVIPQEIENIIRTISISTSRGILFSELRGTYLHNAILPIILNIPSAPSNK